MRAALIRVRKFARYYMDMPAVDGGSWKEAAAMLEGAQPGVLGAELLAALGLGPLDPPPWLGVMQKLGVPPGGNSPGPGHNCDPPGRELTESCLGEDGVCHVEVS